MKTNAALMLACLCILFASGSASAQGGKVQPKGSVTRESGGSIQTPLGEGVVVNEKSSLTREWITIHDPTLPVTLVGTIGVKTVYVSERVGGDYKYTTNFTVELREPVSAIELRFLLFDLWGNHIKTLSMTEVEDLKGTKELSGRWNAYTENEVSEYYASIAFVARVRTQSGRVIEANPIPVVEEARKFSKKFSAEALEPKSETK